MNNEEINMIEGLANGSYAIIMTFKNFNYDQQRDMFSEIFDKNIGMWNELFEKHGERPFSKDIVDNVKLNFIKKIE